MGNDTRTLSEAIIEGLSSRLAQLSDLPLPAQLRQGPTSEESKQGYLSALLRHDPGRPCQPPLSAAAAAAVYVAAPWPLLPCPSISCR